MKHKNSLVEITVKLTPEQAAPFLQAARYHKTEPGNVLLALACYQVSHGNEGESVRELQSQLWNYAGARNVPMIPNERNEDDQFHDTPPAKVA